MKDGALLFGYKWPKDWLILRQDFQRVFHMSMVDIYDPLMSWIMQKFTIDLVSFDIQLHQRFGEYEERGLSMSDIVKENYGSEGLKLMNALL